MRRLHNVSQSVALLNAFAAHAHTVLERWARPMTCSWRAFPFRFRLILGLLTLLTFAFIASEGTARPFGPTLRARPCSDGGLR